MLFKNDVFELDGERYRVLHPDSGSKSIWCISLDSEFAWPVRLPEVEIVDLPSLAQGEVTHGTPSEARLRKCDASWARLAPLLRANEHDLYAPPRRNYLITEYAQEKKCSVGTLRKDLRRYWQRGQNKLALMPGYDKSGRHQGTDGDGLLAVTAGRGRKPKAGHKVYQLTSADAAHMKRVLEATYLVDKRITVVDAYTDLINKHFRHADGNQTLYAAKQGERPSLRQFFYFLKKNYNIEVLLRGREGNKDFERDHRKVLGTVLADCLGVGHFYEIDATIADVFLVAAEDRSKIIGKPTLYLIIDRESHLIVGFYLGLENASWTAALSAILTISEDKRVLCERYGVKYDPADWPAHQVFPMEFLADMGEMISEPSMNICEGLQGTVTNVPGLRPDWKPLVESGFRLLHNAIRPIAPAYDPPWNATRRRGKHFEKDACLTVKEFGKLILDTIIVTNRREMRDYPLSPSQLMAGVRPSPIELWNHGIVTRSGLLTRFSEETVRFALLRKEMATVTERGIEFRGCFYSSQEAIAQKWFETARKRRFHVTVSFDTRLVDQIYVHALDGKSQPHIATLTTRSEAYLGLSFEEVKYLEDLRDKVRAEADEQRLQSRLDLRNRTAPVVENAEAELKALGNKKSRSARRADTKPARAQQLQLERQEKAKLQRAAPQPDAAPVSAERTENAKPTSNQQDLLTALRARMRA
nr:Mu transposase C-terminal domain-containing protein [uncultured Rhodoferax sp.]